MADHIDHGGPAFPCMPPQDTAAGVAVGYPYPDSGMTLRDYFATNCQIESMGDDPMLRVLGELLTGKPHPEKDAVACLVWWAEFRAALRYIEADAMLRARQGGPHA